MKRLIVLLGLVVMLAGCKKSDIDEVMNSSAYKELVGYTSPETYVEVKDVTIKNKGYGSSYYEVTVENISDKDVGYVKVDIFTYDSEGKIVDSQWTNWSGTLKPGATQALTITVSDKLEAWGNFKAELVEVTLK